MASRFAHILSFVNDEIARRDADPPGPLTPSDYWKDFNRFSSYIRYLPDHELRYIRRHTWHLTGERYSAYHFISRHTRRRLETTYAQLVAALGGFKLVEPPDGIGLETPNGLLTDSVLRYGLVLADLYGAGHLRREGPVRVLEIGGGYGGLACLMLQFNPQASYVICDLEETLFVQGVFLAQALGDDKVKLGAPESPLPGHVYLLPQRRAAGLERMRFDLALNQQSMQEMTEVQVARYCDILRDCAQLFYSCNRRSHGLGIVQDKGLIADVHAYLASRFPVIWDSTEHEKPLARIALRHKLARKLLTAFIGKSFLPQGEALLRRFVYRCAP